MGVYPFKRDLGDGPVVLILDFKKRGVRETEVPGDHIARKRLDQDIHISNRPVVVPPGQLDLVFGITEIVLQTDEILICLEVRVGFGDREQASQRRRQLALFPATLTDITDIHGLLAQTRDGLQRLALVAGITLDRFDEIRDQIGAAL